MTRFNQKGFALVETLLILIILAMIGGTGYYVWHSKQETNKSLVSSSKTTTVAEHGKLSFVNSSIPAGWAKDQKGPQSYSLTNDKLGCYVFARVDNPKLDTSLFTSNKVVRNVALAPNVQVPIYYVAPEKEYTISQGFYIASNYDVEVNIACKNVANYTQADAALKALRLQK